MDKTQDADLEKGHETVEDASFTSFFDDEHHAPLFDEEDLFDAPEASENEFDYEPDGAFLD